MLVAATVTPGTTAPLVSLTVPVSVARSLCANSGMTETNETKSRSVKARLITDSFRAKPQNPTRLIKRMQIDLQPTSDKSSTQRSEAEGESTSRAGMQALPHLPPKQPFQPPRYESMPNSNIAARCL